MQSNYRNNTKRIWRVNLQINRYFNKR